jgi:hypothetical protein
MKVIAFFESNQKVNSGNLPVGYDRDSKRVPTLNALSFCELILLHDAEYQSDDEGPRAPKDQEHALVFHHNSGRSRWRSQDAYLERLGWAVAPQQSFSHVPGDPFWSAIVEIDSRQGTPEGKVLLGHLLGAYGDRQTLQWLDQFLLWDLLWNLQPNADEDPTFEDRASYAQRRLPQNLRDVLTKEATPPAQFAAARRWVRLNLKSLSG